VQARRRAAEESGGGGGADNESSDEDGDVYEVHKVTDRRINSDTGALQYKVVWKNREYADDEGNRETTWEPAGNLIDCDDVLAEYYASKPLEGCKYGHHERVCKCHLPLIKSGQDESIYKPFQMAKKTWTIDGYQSTRKKNDGAGLMKSVFVDEVRGFGLPMMEDEVKLVNVHRRRKYGVKPDGEPVRLDLTASPGVRFLDYGTNKEGYWNYELFKEQVMDVIDCYDVLYPEFQVIFSVDWSSGHTAHREGCLNVNIMNVNFGGKQSIPHPSKLEPGCINEDKSIFKHGDTQYFVFRSAEDKDELDAVDDSPPWYKPNAKKDEYLGKAKGKKQVAWERGLWKDGMVEKVADDDLKRDQSLSLNAVLSSCSDFENEITALQELVNRTGHAVVLSPKGHCELAGEGVEYCFGCSKKHFRRTNTLDGRHFRERVLRSISRRVLTLRTTRKFARVARAYKAGYLENRVSDYADIEKMKQERASHRSALDFAGKLCEDALIDLTVEDSEWEDAMATA